MDAQVYIKYKVVFYFCHDDSSNKAEYIDDRTFNSLLQAKNFKQNIDKFVKAQESMDLHSIDYEWGELFLADARPIGDYTLSKKNHIELVVARTHILDEDYVENVTILDNPSRWVEWINKRIGLSNQQQEYVQFALTQITSNDY